MLIVREFGKGHVIEITQAQFVEFSYPSNENLQFYYFGRDACPDCQIFNRDLENWCKINNISLLYYNAQSLFETNRSKYDSLKSEMNISGVPTVLLVENGNIIRSFSGSTIKSSIENYLREYKGE